MRLLSSRAPRSWVPARHRSWPSTQASPPSLPPDRSGVLGQNPPRGLHAGECLREPRVVAACGGDVADVDPRDLPRVATQRLRIDFWIVLAAVADQDEAAPGKFCQD